MRAPSLNAGLITGAVVVALACIAVFVWRPALVLGNDPAAVAESVAGELDGLNGYRTVDDPHSLNHECARAHREDIDLVCSIEAIPAGAVGSGASPRLWQYTVTIDSVGCWEAHPAPAGDDASRPAIAEACIGLFDY